MCVCWSAFYRPHDICPLCGAASEYSESSQAVVAGGPARAGASMQSESTRAHVVQLLNEKFAALMPFKSKTVRARILYVTAESFRKKTNMPLPKFSLQFAFSWSVYFSNRTESYSSQIEFAGPHGIICNFTFSYLILSKTIGRKRLRTQSLVGADLGQLVSL